MRRTSQRYEVKLRTGMFAPRTLPGVGGSNLVAPAQRMAPG
ncbi:hypothetical protein [Streptomyces spiralis]|nr:hypothetical protein [Streptomyces spiralis]